jgi:hypothetical protein
MPLIELGLKAIALGKQGHVFGRKVGDQGIEALPKGLCSQAGAG